MKVRVPATSANLGSGFDVLGLALNLYNTFEFVASEESKIIENNVATKPDNNLIYLSYKKTFDKFGKECIPVNIVVDSNIPMSRGLGSSSACIVGGVVGAYLILNREIDRDEILQIAAEIEGHPDNVAPAIYGNLTATVNKEGKNISVQIKPKNKYKFLALIPDFELSTKKSREILPLNYSMQDVVYNCSRIAFLITSFVDGNDEYLKIGFEDNVHQKYRGALIPDFSKIMNFLQNRTLGNYLSGAGPTIMAIVNNGVDIKDEFYNFEKSLHLNWSLVELELDNKGFEIINC